MSVTKPLARSENLDRQYWNTQLITLIWHRVIITSSINWRNPIMEWHLKTKIPLWSLVNCGSDVMVKTSTTEVYRSKLQGSGRQLNEKKILWKTGILFLKDESTYCKNNKGVEQNWIFKICITFGMILVFCCCLLFNDSLVLELWAETITVRKWMIYYGHMITGDECGPTFPDIYLTVERKPRKNLN